MINSSIQTETILVADACEALCELMEIILVRVGYQVITVNDGLQALDLARIIPTINLLVCDTELPGMRGDELATRFNLLHPSAAVVITRSSSEPIATPAHYELLEKPFTVAELRESVRRALRNRRCAVEMSPAA